MSSLLASHIVGLGLALGLGLLVGLEREWAAHKLIGLRSFALIGLAGGMAALLTELWGGWLVAAGLLVTGGIVVVRYLRHRHPSGAHSRDEPEEVEHGVTTLLAAVAVYLVGAACVAGYQTQAVVMGGVITMLLHWKRPLHGFVERIGRDEFSAIMRFVVITLVVLPVLPNETFGPYDVFNPFQAWLLAVLIVGLNLVGYVAFRLLPADRGAVIAGVLGGLISSTAATVSFAGMTRRNPGLAAGAALIVLIASTVVYGRVGVELALVAPGLLGQAAAPLAAFALVMLVAAALIYPRVRRQTVEMPEQRNPARLDVALTFTALYVVIIFAVAAAKTHVGTDAVYVVALISGLTDVDALTLSVAQLFERGQLPGDVAWRAIFLATLANLLFKIGAACVLGTAALRTYLLSLGGTSLIIGLVLLALWP
ncbi:MAG: hypothetical protein CMQ43_07485 [Gammaproteobacteria bacterium]|nr:hypothetical protein [Gammaproteobacteria bacterium]|tara:strand:+ start:9791 stop:11065 length:1275 start_codon:yes stop_codon:yes gene_type:complete